MRRKQLFKFMAMLLVVAMVGQTVSPMKSYAEEAQQSEQNEAPAPDPDPEPLPVPDRSEEEEKRRQEEEEERKRQEEQRRQQEEQQRQEEEQRKQQEEQQRQEEEQRKQQEEQQRQEEEQRKQQEEQQRQEEEQRKQQEEEQRKQEEEQQKKEQEEKDRIVGENGWMVLSTTALSFGQISQGKKDVDYKILKVTNNGHETHSIAWGLTDPDGVWVVDAPKNVEIPAGKSINFAINPKTDKAGSFDGSLVVTELNVVENITKSVYLSVTIYQEKAWVSEVRVSPASMTLTKGGTGDFFAAVKCGDGATGEVKWSLSGATDKATHIDENGEVYIGPSETASKIDVIATSKDDPSVSDSAVINVNKSSYTIEVTPDPYYAGSVAGGGTFNEGDAVELVAAPASGCSFDGWYKDGTLVTIDKHLKFKAAGNASYVAKFTRNGVRVTTSLNNPKAGVISESKTIEYGGSITLSAKAAEGYQFDAWYEGATKLSSDPNYTLSNVTSDRNIVAAFFQTHFAVTGHITPAKYGVIEGLGMYAKGENVHLEAAPLTGYEFLYWIIDGKKVSKDRFYKIKHIDRDMSVTAVFAKVGENVKTYDITATAGSNGVINPSGKHEVKEGSNMAYSIVASKGYVVDDVKVDGKSVGSKTFYTFKKVTGNHTIEASFKKQTVTAKDAKEATKKKQQSLVDSEDEQIVDGDVSEIMDYQYGVLDIAGITEGKAREMIQSNDDRILMELALYKQTLRVTVTNEYADDPCETDEKSYYDMDSIPNMAMVVNSVLSEDEKIEIFKGTEAKLNVNIVPDEDYPDSYKEQMASETAGKAEVKSYFDISFIKTFDHTPELIENLPVGMRIVLNVPEELKGQGEVCVVRLHENTDGTKTVDILDDEDSADGTVTITTDKLSAYAFAVKTAASDEAADDATPEEKDAPAEQQDNAQEEKSGLPVVPVVIGIVVVAVAGLAAGLLLSKKK